MRRLFFVIMFIIVMLSACDRNEQKTEPIAEGSAAEITIVAVGDSLTAAYGLDEGLGYPALLERKLQESGYSVSVVNSGVSAETSSGTLSRLDWVLTLKPDIVILEIGANDGLRGIDTELLESNLRKIIGRLQAENIVIVFAGMQMVGNLGPHYVGKFNAVYPKLAKEFDLIFFPFFLKDVAMKKELNLSDGIHPNERGYEVIAENIRPYVVNAIKQLEK